MEPEIRRRGEAVLVEFPDDFLLFTFDRWREERGRLTAEVDVQTNAPGVRPDIYRATLTLTSASQKTNFRRECDAIIKDIDWRRRIEEACNAALEVKRVGNAVTIIDAGEQDAVYTDRVAGWVPEGATTVLFGDGGLGKSTIALLLAGAVSLGETFLGVPVERGSVLYVDYEMTPVVQRRRLRRLSRGMEWARSPEVLYYRPEMRIPEISHELLRICDDNHTGLVIVDSLGFGGAASNDPDPVLEVFRVFNQLGRAVVGIHHVSKWNTEKADKPYGSAYNWNAARSVIEIKRELGIAERTIDVALFHRKMNDGVLQRPLGATITFSDDAILVRQRPIESMAAMERHLPVPQRILTVLKRGKMTLKDLTEATRSKDSAVKAALYRLKTRGQVIPIEPTEGKDLLWGLPADESTSTG